MDDVVVHAYSDGEVVVELVVSRADLDAVRDSGEPMTVTPKARVTRVQVEGADG